MVHYFKQLVVKKAFKRQNNTASVLGRKVSEGFLLGITASVILHLVLPTSLLEEFALWQFQKSKK
jgi:hypothetical protein